MFTNGEIRAELIKQLSIEYNCNADDFSKDYNVITEAADNPKRRKYGEMPLFSMVTLGKNSVISADKRMHDWLNCYTADKSGIWLFEHEHLVNIDSELEKYGMHIAQTCHMFLPEETGGEAAPKICSESMPDFEIRWYEQDEIAQFYTGEYPNALCDRFHPERPDVLAVCAVKDGVIAGMAGCSADTPVMWQIGIDVMPNYRGKHIGTTLVALLKDEIFRRGAIPFYGTSLSNLHSWNIALNCGFYPAWVEAYSKA